ncbi:MAG TPA: hypothetical protein VF637_01935 [Sphingomicrobium sp.]
MIAAIALAPKHWKLIVGGIGLAILTIMLLSARSDARHWEKLASQEKAAHAGTVANYRSASEEAARLDALNVIRVRREQSAITERVVHDYQNRIISADARYDRLRDQAKAYSSGGSDPAVSDAREATCRAYAATGCDELPAKLKAAQDNTDKLIALQAWASAQAAVEVSELPH